MKRETQYLDNIKELPNKPIRQKAEEFYESAQKHVSLLREFSFNKGAYHLSDTPYSLIRMEDHDSYLDDGNTITPGTEVSIALVYLFTDHKRKAPDYWEYSNKMLSGCLIQHVTIRMRDIDLRIDGDGFPDLAVVGCENGPKERYTRIEYNPAGHTLKLRGEHYARTALLLREWTEYFDIVAWFRDTIHRQKEK
jgi:hypothetical protein